MKTSCHINALLMATMHEKGTSLYGALVILEHLLVVTLGVVIGLMFIPTNIDKFTKS